MKVRKREKKMERAESETELKRESQRAEKGNKVKKKKKGEKKYYLIRGTNKI